MGVTYDLTNDVGKVRLEIPDTDTRKPIFTDAEIDYFLEASDGNIYLAAAHALGVIMGDPNRSIQWSRGSVSATKNMQDAVKIRIEHLQEKAGGDAFSEIVVERCDWYE